MRILAVETSCDETAISIIEAEGGFQDPVFSVLANITHTQIDIHKEYGGVYPALAKREHGINLPIILKEAYKQASWPTEKESSTNSSSFYSKVLTKFGTYIQEQKLRKLLVKERDMVEPLIEVLQKLPKPDIDYIAVTTGPGLEPALWVGINFARALNLVWGTPLVPVNHMEGHVLSVLVQGQENEAKIKGQHIDFPALALLISGGHTELVLVRDWMQYEVIGQTVDDAVGEAFDKVARILGLEYPGGPKISKLAQQGKLREDISLPRPMLHSGDYNFSFSGIKTAALYLSRELDMTDDSVRASFAKEFETAVTEVLVKKTLRAIDEFDIQTLIIAGGVAANTYIKQSFKDALPASVNLLLPERSLATDNSLMIAIAGYFQALSGNEKTASELVASGNWKLSSKTSH